MIRGVHHVALATADLDRLADFYRRCFAFEVVRRSGWERGSQAVDEVLDLHDSSARVLLLRAGNMYLELFEFSFPPGRPSDPRRPVCDAGYTHVCMEVDDIDAEYQRLLAQGMTFHCPPAAEGNGRVGFRATYGRDLDGNVIELLQVRDGDVLPPLERILRDGE